MDLTQEKIYHVRTEMKQSLGIQPIMDLVNKISRESLDLGSWYLAPKV